MVFAEARVPLESMLQYQKGVEVCLSGGEHNSGSLNSTVGEVSGRGEAWIYVEGALLCPACESLRRSQIGEAYLGPWCTSF